jgi:hypothetical protein
MNNSSRFPSKSQGQIPRAAKPQQQMIKQGQRPALQRGLVQPRMTNASQSVKRPVAPPVYRPQPTPQVLQRKVPAGLQPKVVAPQPGRAAPAAPPVYRPQPVPKVLQLKKIGQPQSPAAPPLVKRPQPSVPVRSLPGQTARAQPSPLKQAATTPLHQAKPPIKPTTAAPAGIGKAGTVQAKRSSVIQLTADEDLKDASKNFKYAKNKAENLELRGNDILKEVGNLPNKTKQQQEQQEKMANSLFKFTQGVLDQYEGHYQELREFSRLLFKGHGKDRTPILSTDKVTDPDLSYANSKGRAVAKEIKAVSSDVTGTVTQRIKEAIDQLSLRNADRKKALVVIAERENSWPFNKNAKRDPNQIEAKFKEKIESLDPLNYLLIFDEVRVDGITDVNGDTHSAVAKWVKGKLAYTVTSMDKHPSSLTPKKVIKEGF